MADEGDAGSAQERGRAPIVIGLTGGIAAGKSFVAEALRELGAERIDADKLAHEALERPAVRSAVVERFGPGVLSPAGAVDRAALAKAVFGDAAALRFLESLIHPSVAGAIADRLEALRVRTGEPRRAAILDVPLLLEVGMGGLCDEIVFVDATEATRAASAKGRGWEAGALEAREARQWPLAQKRDAATCVVSSTSPDVTKAEVAAFYRERVAPRLGAP